jgi:hypothetical protein
VRLKEINNCILDFCAEPRRGAALQIPHYQYHWFNRTTRYCLLISCILLTSCKKDEDKPRYEGEVVLTSEKVKQGDDYNTLGFSFEKGDNVPYPYTTDVVPDLVVTHFIDLNQNLIVTFTSPNNQEAFFLNETAGTAVEAKSWYDSYLEVTATGFITLADSVTINQIWTVQTISKKYAKLLIKEIKLLNDSPVAEYVEVKVDYKYQPDGSRIF